MRKFLLLATLLFAVGASAQTSTPAADHGWQRVEALSAGKKIHVNTLSHAHTQCRFEKADAETLTCGGATFQRANIVSIKAAHRGLSVGVGLAVGYIVAGVVGDLAYNHCNSSGCAAAAGLVALGALIAIPILAFTYDLCATTIYKTE